MKKCKSSLKKIQVIDTKNESHPQKKKEIIDKKTAMRKFFPIYIENSLLFIWRKQFILWPISLDPSNAPPQGNRF